MFIKTYKFPTQFDASAFSREVSSIVSNTLVQIQDHSVDTVKVARYTSDGERVNVIARNHFAFK